MRKMINPRFLAICILHKNGFMSDALLLCAAADGVAPAVLLSVGRWQYLFNVPEGTLIIIYYIIFKIKFNINMKCS